MRFKICFTLLLLIYSSGLLAQQLDSQRIRIVDTLSVKDKATRNAIILQTELDSLIKQYTDSQVQQVVKEPEKETMVTMDQYILAGLLAIITLLGFIIYAFYRHRRKINETISALNEQPESSTSKNDIAPNAVSKEKKGKVTAQVLEGRIKELNNELHKLAEENNGLSQVIKEYNGIQQEYDSLKHGFLRAYKVKNYPGYDKLKDETMAMQGVLQTENAVAAYAYEKFLKPILAITDANKNSPANLNKADREKLLDMLVSMSLLYIEYLYLRVNELSIGGKMVERIKGFSKGNGPDISLLKKLNTEFGSRALVIKMALDKAELHKLSYPVFDETNLNTQ